MESFDGLSPDNFPILDLSEVPKQLGYLKNLGLDYGWGFSTMMEQALESLHIYGGLSWCASVVAVAVLVRLALIKPVLTASDVSAKLNHVKPIVTPIRERMLKCVREQDNHGALKAKQELAVVHEQYKLKPWKAFVPMLQIPLGFGCFRVMRGMAQLPVPGLEEESFLWISNVTAGDPYFILPVMTGAMMFMAIKVCPFRQQFLFPSFISPLSVWQPLD